MILEQNEKSPYIDFTLHESLMLNKVILWRFQTSMKGTECVICRILNVLFDARNGWPNKSNLVYVVYSINVLWIFTA